MRPISRHALARQLANDIARSGDAACRGRGRWWSQLEAEHAAAASPEAAIQAAAPAMSLCARCPVLDQCRELADLDNYTGLAAGAAMFGGTRSATSRVRNSAVSRSPRSPAQRAG